MGGEIAQIAGGVGQTVGGLWVAYHFVRWAFEFMARRHDARAEKLDKQQERVDASLAKRLEKLEKQEETREGRIEALEASKRDLEDEVARYHSAVVILAGEMHIICPENPKLEEVSRLLNRSLKLPLSTPADMTAQLGRMK